MDAHVPVRATDPQSADRRKETLIGVEGSIPRMDGDSEGAGTVAVGEDTARLVGAGRSTAQGGR